MDVEYIAEELGDYTERIARLERVIVGLATFSDYSDQVGLCWCRHFPVGGIHTAECLAAREALGNRVSPSI